MTNNSTPLNLTDSDDSYALSPERPRLYVDLRDPDLPLKLKEQAAHSDRTLKAYVNDALERFVSQPLVFSDHLVDNFDSLVSFFDALPMEQVRQLAEASHRPPSQMLVHLLMKGLKAYTALEDGDRD